MSIKDSLSFLQRHKEPHEIDGTDIDFYSISIKKLFKLGAIAGPISRAIATFFDDKTKDAEVVTREWAEKDGARRDDYESKAISPEMAELRIRKKSEAIQQLIDALTGDDNSLLLAELIFDSARDLFPRDPSKKDLEEFLNSVDAGQMTEFVIGLILGNKKAFGPLADRVVGGVKSFQTAQTAKTG